MKSFVVALLLVTDLRVGDTAVQLNELNAVELSGLHSSRYEVTTSNDQRQR